MDIPLRDHMEQRIGEMERRAEAIEARMLLHMTQQAESTERSVERLAAAIDGLNERLREVETLLAQMQGRLVAVGMVWSIVLIAVAAFINSMLR